MVVVVAAAAGVARIPVVMLVLMLMFVLVVVMVLVIVPVIPGVLPADLLHELLRQGDASLHGGDDLRSGELLPGGGEDGGLGFFSRSSFTAVSSLPWSMFWVRERRMALACSTWLLKNSPKFFI